MGRHWGSIPDKGASGTTGSMYATKLWRSSWAGEGRGEGRERVKLGGGRAERRAMQSQKGGRGYSQIISPIPGLKALIRIT